MGIDTETVGSPGWWLLKLDAARTARNGPPYAAYCDSRQSPAPGGSRRAPLNLLAAHFDGNPPLSTTSAGWQPGMREYLRMSQTCYAEMIVGSCVSRMVPLGFYTAADSDFDGDRKAAEVFRANDLDLVCAETFSHMCAFGDGYQIVGAPDVETGIPRVTAEDPRMVITADDPASGRARAALKVAVDEWTGDEVVHVFVPGAVYGLRRKPMATLDTGEWDPRLGGPLPAGFEDVVPVIRFQNWRGRGEFESHLTILNRINDAVFDRLIIGKNQAHRQMAVKNLPGEDETGKKIDYRGVFTRDPGSFWQVPEGVDFWESQPIDLGPLRLATQDDVKTLCAVTRTPLHWITPDAAQGSAEGASLQRESSTTKIEDRRRRGNRGQSRSMALVFRFMGDSQRGDSSKIVTIWQPVERSSLAEQYDAATKAAAVGMPFPAIGQHVLQLTPDEIGRVEAQRTAELLLAPVTAAEGAAAAAAAGLGPAAAASTPAAAPAPAAAA